MELISDMPAVEAAEDVSSVRLRIPAKPEYVALGRLALTGLAQARALPSDTIADLKLALTEAVSNSVRHAYGTPGDGLDPRERRRLGATSSRKAASASPSSGRSRTRSRSNPGPGFAARGCAS